MAGNYFQVKNSLIRQRTNIEKTKKTKEHNKLLANLYGYKREKRSYANNLQVARNNFKLLAYSNKTKYTKFISLTTQEIMTIEQFSLCFNRFIKALNKTRETPLPYLGMYELQERGAPHIHFFAFDDNKISYTYLKTILKMWRGVIGGLGSVNIETARDHHINYLLSYMTKQGKDKIGNKSIVRSRGNLKSYQSWDLDQVPKEIINNYDFNVEYARYKSSENDINEYENIYGKLVPFGDYSFSDLTTLGKVSREHSLKWLIKNKRIDEQGRLIKGRK